MHLVIGLTLHIFVGTVERFGRAAFSYSTSTTNQTTFRLGVSRSAIAKSTATEG